MDDQRERTPAIPAQATVDDARDRIGDVALRADGGTAHPPSWRVVYQREQLIPAEGIHGRATAY